MSSFYVVYVINPNGTIKYIDCGRYKGKGSPPIRIAAPEHLDIAVEYGVLH